MLPVYSYELMDAQIMLRIDSLIKEIKELGDVFYVPVDFYSTKDIHQVDFSDLVEMCYSEHHDEMSMFIDLIYQSKQDNITYDDLLNMARQQNDYQEAYTGFIKDQVDEESAKYCYIATDRKSLRSLYRCIAEKFSEYEHLYLWRKRCFPELLFTADAFDNSSKIGSYRNNYNEIQKCLSVLNDEGSMLYPNSNEEEVLKIMQSKCGVNCSGKGAKESSTFKKKIKMKVNEYKDFQFEISCIPHFKLDTIYSNKRLYFSWGRNEIDNHKIIVVHIGEHWSSVNEKESVVELE